MHHDASLNIRQLQVFEAVARLESYSRAQQELGISVSAISNAMSQLEGQLGFILCQRGRGGFSLTEKGQQFLQQAIRVLSELNELERQSALLKGEHSESAVSVSMESSVEMHKVPLCSPLSSADCRSSSLSSLSTRIACCKNC